MRLLASIWSNGSNGWGLKILGGSETRGKYFDRTTKEVLLDLDGKLCPFNIYEKSFWTKSCGELIGKELRNWIQSHELRSGQRIQLDILEDKRKFRPIPPN
jgi:hypothetical protein